MTIDHLIPERCPSCKLSWVLFPPVVYQDVILNKEGRTEFKESNGIRCVECKSAYRIDMVGSLADRVKELEGALKIVCEASQLAVSALDSDDPGADSMMQKFWRSLELARAALHKDKQG